MAPTSLVYQNLKGKIYPEVWDAIVLSILKAMREPVTWVKQYSSHTFFLFDNHSFTGELGGKRRKVFVMYNYIVKFTYEGKSYESVFSNVALFNEKTEDEILAKQASEAANNYVDSCNLRKSSIHIGELQLYRVIDEGEKLIWEKK